MIIIRKALERGKTDIDWLQSYHTFSFSNYHDPQNVHFRNIRVINDDYIAPSKGFPTHPHNDMEIITFIDKGELAHTDSLGNGSTIKAGDIQKMTAGSGILHSEYNPSATDDVHLYQIWIFPNKKGLTPSYEQVTYDKLQAKNDFLLLASQGSDKSAVQVNQDVSLYLSILEKGGDIVYQIKQGRYVWIQVVSGDLRVNENIVSTGDGLAISNESLITCKAVADSKILLFDLG